MNNSFEESVEQTDEEVIDELKEIIRRQEVEVLRLRVENSALRKKLNQEILCPS